MNQKLKKTFPNFFALLLLLLATPPGPDTRFKLSPVGGTGLFLTLPSKRHLERGLGLVLRPDRDTDGQLFHLADKTRLRAVDHPDRDIVELPPGGRVGLGPSSAGQPQPNAVFVKSGTLHLEVVPIVGSPGQFTLRARAEGSPTVASLHVNQLVNGEPCVLSHSVGTTAWCLVASESSPQPARPLAQQPQQQQQQPQQVSPKSQVTSASDVVIEDFEAEVSLGERIGSGAFSAVHRGRWRGMEVAVKLLHSPCENEFLSEAMTLASLRSPHVVQFLAVAPARSALLTELMDLSLSQLLHSRREFAIDQGLARTIITDVARGLTYLHSQRPRPVVHRDLKSLNVLLKISPCGKAVSAVKISDFGLSCMKSERSLHTVAGTIAYQAPEVIRGQGYGLAVDVYALGVMIWEICHRERPFAAVDNLATIVFLVAVSGKRPSTATPPIEGTEDLLLLANECMATDPEARPKVGDILDKLEGR
jgi:hypothetical protein